ncbi:MAG: TolC family protein [Phocaeicola sp.]|nr:TolC family protein [Phocaeicola sp.]MDD7447834.1 TolC family protein [Prevotellaceae bacterium]MDY3914434.1 TolC family protein [Phocaeicola sp.]MDY5938326.1 TolC family protein [Phocaeicola sp.]
MKIRYIIVGMSATALLSGCGIYKSYKRPESISTENIYRDIESVEEKSLGELSWKEVFTDPSLQVLIAEGLEKNVDVLSAALRVEEAQAMLKSARLSFLPTLAFAPQGTLTKMENLPVGKAYSLPLAASWEIDLFGKVLNTARGRKVAYEKSKFAEQAVRSQIISGIANTYYSLLMLDKQVMITSNTAEIWKEYVRTMEAMKQAGMVTELAVTQSKATYHQVSASLLELQRKVRETENALSTLIGRGVGQVERTTIEAQILPTKFNVGVPASLLENRPDVKMAEMTLASAYYTTNQAKAAFYPSLNIQGSGIWTNGSGINVANPGQLILQGLASLTQPIFQHGKLIANLKVSKAEERIAQMQYQQALLEAGKEVSNALFLYENQQQKLDMDRARVQELEKAVSYSQMLFRSASATYLDLLTAQQNLLNAQLTEVSDKFLQMQALISLYSALGGGAH